MAKTRKVAFTEEAAGRVARATLAFERGNRDQSPIRFRTASDEGDPIRIGKTTATWLKGTLATITLYEDGTPPSETTASPAETLEECVNKFADVPSNKWVSVARAANGSWYLIAAEC
jgi:hypothetical protein